jgi:hypothetical protein
VAGLVSRYSRVRDGEQQRDGVTDLFCVGLFVVPAALDALAGRAVDDGDVDPEVPLPVAGIPGSVLAA